MLQARRGDDGVYKAESGKVGPVGSIRGCSSLGEDPYTKQVYGFPANKLFH